MVNGAIKYQKKYFKLTIDSQTYLLPVFQDYKEKFKSRDNFLKSNWNRADKYN